MEYFKSSIKTVLGAQSEQGQPTGAETIEKLVERVQTATLLDDRRDAVRALKSLSKKFKLEVGAQAMDTMLSVIEKDRADPETVGYAVDTLYNVLSPETDGDGIEKDPGDNAELIELANQFTEIFIKKPENVLLILDLLDEYDFHLRWPTVKLMTALLTNRAKETQEIVISSPMAVSKLMDLLSDSREVIRNDEQQLSYKCLSDHNYVRSYCSDYFENYRNCKAFWNKVRMDRKRSGVYPHIPAVEDRARVQAEYFAKPGFR